MKIFWLLFITLNLGSAYAQDDFSDDFEDEEVTFDQSEEIDEKSLSDSPSKKNSSEPTNSGFEGTKPDVSQSEVENLERMRKTGNTDKIVAAAAVILGKDQTHLKALNTLAVHYFSKEKYGLAKLILKRALKDHPEEPALHNNLGVIYLSEGDMPLAIESFRKSLSRRSNYRFGAGNISSIFLEYGDYKRGLGPLEDNYKALRSDLGRGSRTAAEVANNYAVSLMGINEFSSSARIFKEIMDSGVRLPEAYLNYSILLVEGQNKKKDAISVISKLKFMTEDREILNRVRELEKQIQ